MTQITQQTLYDVYPHLLQAYEKALIGTWDEKSFDFHRVSMMVALKKAATVLGYKFVPLPEYQDKPDSGRPSIPETEPSVGEQF